MKTTVLRFVSASNGRRWVLYLVLWQICIELMGLVWLILYTPPVRTYVAVGRIILTCGLGFWLYNGSRIARWLTVVLMGLGGMSILVTCYTQATSFSHFQAKAVYQLLFAWLLVRNVDIAAFFRESYEQERTILTLDDLADEDRPADCMER